MKFSFAVILSLRKALYDLLYEELENTHCNWSRFYSLKPPQLCTKRAHIAILALGYYCVYCTHTLTPNLGLAAYMSPEAQWYLLISAFYSH